MDGRTTMTTDPGDAARRAAPGRTLPWAPVLAGVVAAAAAIGVSELVAGFVAGFPSLVTSIGGLVISLQPPGAKDLMASLFGVNDKLVLNVVVVAAALAIAAVAGILARRRLEIGVGIFVAFGIVGGLAAARDPLNGSVVSILSAAIAVGVGLFVLIGLIGLLRLEGVARVSPIAARPGSGAAMPDWDRRRFLIASAGTLGGAVVVGAVGRGLLEGRHTEGVISAAGLPAPLTSVPALTADQSFAVDGITPIVVPPAEFYRIDTALLVPQVDVSTWTLKVGGMVDRPQAWTYDDLLAMPLFEQYVTIGCVSNQIGGSLIGNALWTGVRLKDVLDAAGIQPGATQIVGRSVDGFTAGFPTDWATDPDREPMIAVGMDRAPLPAAHGFPARLIIPGLFGYVSATKWLSEIQLTTREAVDGYWVPLGWAKDAPMLTQSRIDTPRRGETVSAGNVHVAGLAWAPDRGVSGVEVRVDEAEWVAAAISRPISGATWVHWLLNWDAVPGSHALEVRAIDGTGEIQTGEQTLPAPDGARGHHRITLNVT
jgi:DMSO/TMAO reductase YedYZ molybdopterin-dependent catalytic subunit